MKWNGNIITSPVLIFHDEILFDAMASTDHNRQGLVCKIGNGGQGWYFPTGQRVQDASDIRQIELTMTEYLLLSRLQMTPNTESRNGLWTCRQTRTATGVEIPVGLYHRGQGNINIKLCILYSCFKILNDDITNLKSRGLISKTS